MHPCTQSIHERSEFRQGRLPEWSCSPQRTAWGETEAAVAVRAVVVERERVEAEAVVEAATVEAAREESTAEVVGSGRRMAVTHAYSGP